MLTNFTNPIFSDSLNKKTMAEQSLFEALDEADNKVDELLQILRKKPVKAKSFYVAMQLIDKLNMSLHFAICCTAHYSPACMTNNNFVKYMLDTRSKIAEARAFIPKIAAKKRSLLLLDITNWKTLLECEMKKGELLSPYLTITLH